MDALNWDVFSSEAISVVLSNSLGVSLDSSGLLGEVSLLGEVDVVSGGTSGLSVLLGSSDGDSVFVDETLFNVRLVVK